MVHAVLVKRKWMPNKFSENFNAFGLTNFFGVFQFSRNKKKKLVYSNNVYSFYYIFTTNMAIWYFIKFDDFFGGLINCYYLYMYKQIQLFNFFGKLLLICFSLNNLNGKFRKICGTLNGHLRNCKFVPVPILPNGRCLESF